MIPHALVGFGGHQQREVLEIRVGEAGHQGVGELLHGRFPLRFDRVAAALRFEQLELLDHPEQHVAAGSGQVHVRAGIAKGDAAVGVDGVVEVA